MKMNDIIRLERIRSEVSFLYNYFEGPQKSGEGRIEVDVPCLSTHQWCVTLISYVYCPDGRGSEFYGNSLGECLDQLEGELEEIRQEVRKRYEVII